MDRREILEKKLETLEELEKIGEAEGHEESDESKESRDIMSLYVPRPPRAAMESAMERLRKLNWPW